MKARRTRAVAAPPRIAFRSSSDFSDLYGMKITGDCLEPDLLDGDEVVFSATEPVKAGDFAIFVLRPEIVKPGGLQCTIKRLVTSPPHDVTFPYQEHPGSECHALVIAEQTNPRRQFAVRCDRLLAVHRFVRVQRREVQT